MEGCLYNVRRLHWLRVAPQVRPRVYTFWLRQIFPSIPSSTASRTYHPCSDTPICARGTTNLQSRRCFGSNRSSWPLIEGSSSSSSEPGESLKEEGEAKEEEIVARDVNNGQEGEQDDRTWKFEPRAFNPKAKAPPAAVDLLSLTERELLSQCKMETFRASGPGGQHRNKTDSGVRLRHLPTGLVSQGTEDRSQQNNRVQALRRLRQLIAIEVRRPVELVGYSPPPELIRILPSSAKSGKKREGGQQIGPNHDDYVLGMQQLLDLLWTVKGSISECAALLGLSTGVLSRLIVSDKKLWNAVNTLRATHNLKPLRGDN